MMRINIPSGMLLRLLLIALLIAMGHVTFAQRAKERRQGTLPTDSVMAKHQADSLALLRPNPTKKADTLTLQLPIDTAAVARQTAEAQAEITKKRWIPNSAKSVWLALAIPGAGQIYNRKYWKLPIIYGGFVGCMYALNWNSGMYREYSQAYQDIVSNNPNNTSYLDFLPPNVNVNSDLSRYQQIFKRRKDFYRRQRDLSIIVLMGVYVLSVIDAYVDAELSNFDISDDLSMQLAPDIFNVNNSHLPKGIGLSCSFKF